MKAPWKTLAFANTKFSAGLTSINVFYLILVIIKYQFQMCQFIRLKKNCKRNGRFGDMIVKDNYQGQSLIILYFLVKLC